VNTPEFLATIPASGLPNSQAMRAPLILEDFEANAMHIAFLIDGTG